MARYIDADKLIEALQADYDREGAKADEMAMIGNDDISVKYSHGQFCYLNAIERVKDTPTADVVPKSEVERLQEEANRYKRYFFRHDYDEMIAEVLDKLDRFINANCIEIKDERGIKGYVTSGVHFAIAELKKKYTGGNNDEN